MVLRYLVEKLNSFLAEPYILKPQPNADKVINWEGWNYRMGATSNSKMIDVRDIESINQSWYQVIKLHFYENAYWYIGGVAGVCLVYLGYEWYQLFPDNPGHVDGSRLATLWDKAVKPLFTPIWSVFGGTIFQKTRS